MAGLEVTVKPTRTSDSLVINGDIVNSAQVTRRVPRLRVSLRDGNKTELDARIIDPPVVTLAPGATAHFDTTFEHPSITATGVAVTFASQGLSRRAIPRGPRPHLDASFAARATGRTSRSRPAG